MGVTVTYSCFLSRSKLRTAGVVTHLQEVDGNVLFLLKTVKIFILRICRSITNAAFLRSTLGKMGGLVTITEEQKPLAFFLYSSLSFPPSTCFDSTELMN